MQDQCPGQYAFAPVTWDYPREHAAFRRHARTHPGATYIVKPTASSMGRGIYLVRGDDRHGGVEVNTPLATRNTEP